MMRRFAFAFLALLLLRADMYPDASNAKQPEARGNIIYTPASCDGWQVSDGAITTGTAALTSATGSFTAADVGKRILVAGAGAESVFQSYTVVAGGANYAVGDIITLLGGTSSRPTKLAVLATNAGAVTEVMMWSPYADVGSYTAVPANPVATSDAVDPSSSTGGTGTGLTLNVGWKKSSLSTTIAGVSGTTAATLGAPAGTTVSGAMVGYGSDYTAQISAALASGAELPPGICGHASQINLATSDSLIGQGGSGAGSNYRTTLMWLGASGGIQVKGGTTSGSTTGVRFGGLALDGMCSAGTGLWFNGISESTIQPITVRRHIQMGMMEDAASSGNNVGVVKWHQPFIGETNASCNGLGDYTAGLVYGPGFSSNGDVFQNDYYGMVIQSKNAPGFLCGNSDTNRFYNTVIQTTSGTGPSIDALGSTTAAHGCRDHQMDLTAALGTVRLRGSTSGYSTASARRLKIDWNQSSGATTFIDEPNTSRWGQNNNGRAVGAAILPTNFADLPSVPVDGNIGYINDSSVTSAGALVSAGGGASLALVVYKGTPPSGGWRVVQTIDTPQKLGIVCSTFAAASGVPHISGDLFCVSDSTVNAVGDLVAGSGSFRVLAMASNTGTGFRVVGGINTRSTRLTVTAFSGIAGDCNAALEGTMFAVTDSSSAVFNAAMAGGGANHVIGYCNGTAWVVH